MQKINTDTAIQPLIAHFQQLLPLTDTEKRMVAQTFRPRLYRKKQYVLQEGDTCTLFHFVVSGCLRLYKIDNKGTVHIVQFAAENYFISDLDSFYNGKPSALTIDALEDTQVLQVTLQDLITLYTNAPLFHRIFRVLVENNFVTLQQRLLQTISSTAEERYRYFFATYPNLVNRLPQTQIASFIGITPEFLSRLRNKLSKQNS